MVGNLHRVYVKIVGVVCIVGGMASGLTGCKLNPSKADIPPANTTSKIVDRAVTIESNPISRQPTPTVNTSPPFVIFIAIDKTGSVTTSKIPSLTIDQVKSLAQAVAKVGGEIRLGDVCTDSDRPLASFYISEPPTPLAAVELQKPTLQTAGNPLDLPKLNAEYRKQLASYQQQKAAHDKEVAARDRLIEQKMATFTSSVAGLLKQSAKCGATDIVGMAKRADLYLNEPNSNWRQQPRRVAMLITDGLETVKAHPQPIEWTSKAEVVLVSSGGEAGILKPLLTNTPFESIDAAIRYVIGR
jgi:hypothetical protein